MSIWNDSANGRDENPVPPMDCPYCGAGQCPKPDDCREEDEIRYVLRPVALARPKHRVRRCLRAITQENQ